MYLHDIGFASKKWVAHRYCEITMDRESEREREREREEER